MQPDLPTYEEPRTVEYFPPCEDETPWTIRDWHGLKAAFSLTQAEINLWHEKLAGQARPWKVIKRIFGVMAMMGDAVEDEDEEDWDWKKLAKREGIKEQVLREDLEAAVQFWKREKLASRMQPATRENSNVKPIDEMRGFAAGQSLDDDKVDHLLRIYRFGNLKKDDRLFAANRILELRTLFEDPTRREQARQLIVMELNIQDNEATRALLKERLSVLSHKADQSDITADQSKEILNIRTALDANVDSHTKLFDKYRAAAADLGAEEMEQGELRKVALGVASQWVESCRQYHTTGDRTLIDGMFTADELIWQTTPIPMRPAQYRPDIVQRVNEAMQSENLWNPNYVPTSISREASRRLLRLARALEEESETPPIPEIDEAPGDEDEESTIDPVADTPADPSPPPAPAAPVESTRPQAVEEFMVIG
jgi:hypothetical protein